MATKRQVVSANLSSLMGADPAKTTRNKVQTAAPTAPMPEWLKSMSKEARQKYFEENPNSMYNPNRDPKAPAPEQEGAPASKPAAPPAGGGHGKTLAKHVNEKNVKSVASSIKKHSASGAQAAVKLLDGQTKVGAVAAAKKLRSDAALDDNDKGALFKTMALVGGAAAAVTGAVGAALMAPAILTNPDMAHEALEDVGNAIKNAPQEAMTKFSGLAKTVGDSVSGFIERKSPEISTKATEIGDWAEKSLGADNVQALRDFAGKAKAAPGQVADWAGLKGLSDNISKSWDEHVAPRVAAGAAAAGKVVDDVSKSVNDTVQQVKDRIDPSGGVDRVAPKGDYDAATQRVQNDPTLRDEYGKGVLEREAPKPEYDNPDNRADLDRKLDQSDNITRNAGRNHPMSDEDYAKKIGEATKDAPGYNDKDVPVRVKGPGEIIQEKLAPVTEGVKNAAQSVKDAAGRGADAVQRDYNELKDAGSKAAEGLKDYGQKSLDALNRGVEDIKRDGGKALDDAKNFYNKLTAPSEGPSVADKAQGLVDGVKKGAGDVVDGLKKSAGDLDSQIKQASKEGSEKALQTVKDVGQKVYDQGKKELEDNWDTAQKRTSAWGEGAKKGVSDLMLKYGLKRVE